VKTFETKYAPIEIADKPPRRATGAHTLRFWKYFSEIKRIAGRTR
jgi:hypothetical protein